MCKLTIPSYQNLYTSTPYPYNGGKMENMTTYRKMYKRSVIADKFNSLLLQEIMEQLFVKETLSWLELESIQRFMPSTGVYFTAFLSGKITQRKLHHLEDHSV